MNKTLTENHVAAVADDDAMQMEYDFSRAVRGRQEEKYYLALAGEFFVAGELNRRGIFATVTYGAAKNADVMVVDDQTGQSAVIEVKTTALPNRRWITGRNAIRPESVRPNHFWALVLLPALNGDSTASPRFFVFTSEEIVNATTAIADSYAEKYLQKHGTPFASDKGVYGLSLEEVEATQTEARWEKITNWLHRK